jgi:hypothetical protein
MCDGRVCICDLWNHLQPPFFFSTCRASYKYPVQEQDFPGQQSWRRSGRLRVSTFVRLGNHALSHACLFSVSDKMANRDSPPRVRVTLALSKLMAMILAQKSTFDFLVWPSYETIFQNDHSTTRESNITVRDGLCLRTMAYFHLFKEKI